LWALAALALVGCNRTSRAEAGAPLLELRDARGELRLSVHRAGEGFRWVDAGEGEGALAQAAGGGLRGPDPHHGVLELQPLSEGGLELRAPHGRLLELRRVDGVLRLGDGKGIPIARVRIEAAEALAHDAGGQVVARARREGGRIVVVDRASAVSAFVRGDVSVERAALVALPVFTAGERAALLVAASWPPPPPAP
jgi:hypothetical protein